MRLNDYQKEKLKIHIDEALKTAETDDESLITKKIIELDGLFSNIPGWYKSLYSSNKDDGDGLYRHFNSFETEMLKQDLILMANKLKSLTYEFPFNKNVESNNINVTQQSIQNVTQSVEIAISNVFENLNNISMPDNEYNEIKEQLNLLIDLINKEPKRTRWEKAKNIIKWLTDKSLDVFIASLPLLSMLNK